MSEQQDQPISAPPVSAFTGPVAELIAQRMLLPPTRPGLLAALDHFEILRVLGGGGMGIVLLARDSETGREVAVKLIRTDLVTNQQIVHRFLKEAGHLKRLRHTNIVPVQEISDRAEAPYFVMPYFEKGSLTNRIKPEKPLDAETILDVATQVAEGLSFAHRSGIIHRDLKPANVLLGASGQVCLADFGLARTMFNDTIVDVESRQGEGTAPYMSPGVAAGDAEDTRCDIYSFGALLYEMLTGQPPYKGRGTKEILDQIIAGPPGPILHLNQAADKRLAAVSEKAMARELRDRYADMRDVLKDLQLIREGKPFLAQGETGEIPIALKLILISVVIAALALLGWAIWPRHSEPAVPHVVTQPVVPPPVLPPRPPPQVSTSTITTLSGQVGISGFADGPGAKAQFRSPNSVAVDGVGNIYVADTGNNVIRKIATNGVVSTLSGVAGEHGSADGTGSAARFWTPFGIAVDGAGNVYVADTGNNTIRKITPDGTVSTLAGLAAHPGSEDGIGANARFRNPWSVAVDNLGNVYTADMSNDTIRKITPAGSVTTLAGQPGKSGSSDGIGSEVLFNHPFAVAVDRLYNVYVSDSANNTIRMILSGGAVTTVAGSSGETGNSDGVWHNARFTNPQALAVDFAGNIYVADTGNNLIRKISAGKVTTLAIPAGANVQLNNPGGVAVDKAGNVYVADTGNQCVRKIVQSEGR